MIKVVSPVGVSKITSNYRVSIPPEVKEELKLKIGDFIAFFKDENNGKVFIKKVSM